MVFKSILLNIIGRVGIILTSNYYFLIVVVFEIHSVYIFFLYVRPFIFILTRFSPRVTVFNHAVDNTIQNI